MDEAAVAYDIAAVLFRGTVNNRQLNFSVERAVSEAHKHLREPWFALALAKCGGCAPTPQAQALLAAVLVGPPLEAPMWAGPQLLPAPSMGFVAAADPAAAMAHLLAAAPGAAAAMVSAGPSGFRAAMAASELRPVVCQALRLLCNDAPLGPHSRSGWCCRRAACFLQPLLDGRPQPPHPVPLSNRQSRP